MKRPKYKPDPVMATIRLETTITLTGDRGPVEAALKVYDRFKGRPIDWLLGLLAQVSWDITDAQRAELGVKLLVRPAGEVGIFVESHQPNWQDAEVKP